MLLLLVVAYYRVGWLVSQQGSDPCPRRIVTCLGSHTVVGYWHPIFALNEGHSGSIPGYGATNKRSIILKREIEIPSLKRVFDGAGVQINVETDEEDYILLDDLPVVVHTKTTFTFPSGVQLEIGECEYIVRDTVEFEFGKFYYIIDDNGSWVGVCLKDMDGDHPYIRSTVDGIGTVIYYDDRHNHRFVRESDTYAGALDSRAPA